MTKNLREWIRNKITGPKPKFNFTSIGGSFHIRHFGAVISSKSQSSVAGLKQGTRPTDMQTDRCTDLVVCDNQLTEVTNIGRDSVLNY